MPNALPAVRRYFGALCTTALVLALSSGAAGAKSTTTTTTTAPTPSPADVWLIKAIGAENKVGSVRINGVIHQGSTIISLSLLVNGDGEGGGTFVQQGSIIQLKRVGPLLYFNAPKKFWAAHSNATQAKTYGGKWIEVSALDSRFQSFDQFLNAGDLVSAVFSGHTTPLALSKPTKLNGQKVVIVSDTVTVKGKKTTGKMYIAATGRPNVLKIVDKGPTESGTITFSHYGKAVSISTPPEPINLAR
ncbi:MAG TPA: hypothetical protein VNG12_09705 [Acidimicrobiales bacterium]|nr:hypothetical protein [Acidimicrobiales bacterium]